MVRMIGQGAMGAVYEAEHTGTGKRVAIKWLHPHVMENRMAVERLMREAQASARVRHSNVVDVYDVEREGDALFLVMEYLEGEPLSNMLERGGEPFHLVLGLIAQAMRGVAEAHRQGIVHRDIKPDNIFLSYQSDRAQPIAKVLDFGISKLDTPTGGLSLTQTGSALGTPLYMSYEQLSGSRDVDARSDIYAFGVIMYEALTGLLPYSAENFAELAAKVITTDPPTPRQLRPEIPEVLDQIINWAMRKRREERPPNLGVLLDALHPFTLPPESQRLSDSLSTRATSLPPPPPSMSASPSQSGSRMQPYQAPLAVRPTSWNSDSGTRSGARPFPQSSSPPPVMPAPSSAPPSLRLPSDYNDWDQGLERSQRARREMESRVTALMAGTSEYSVPKRSSAGVWVAIGALAVVGGAGAFFAFVPTHQQPTANPAAASADLQPSKQPSWPPPAKVGPDSPAATQPAAQAEPPVALPPAEPPQAEQAKPEPEPAQVEAPAVPVTHDAGVAARATAAQKPVPKPAVRAQAWRPSGEDFVYSPPPAEPVAPVVVEAPPAPEPEKPKVIEVPGTAPNPFADEQSPAPEDRYRAGRPKEDEF
jgi:eukaryotic-like serine/threonine-protein kinase